MHVSHPLFRLPADPSGKIWQYMDMPKFVSMLQRKQLFFAKASAVRDPYEGVVPQYSSNNAGEPPAKAGMWRRMQDYRGRVLINSWHYNEYESAAMWQLYSQENAGIAVQSTAGRLSRCFEGNKDDAIWIGTVDYRDYSKEREKDLDIFEAFLVKRKSFEYENEIRAVTCLPAGRDSGAGGEASRDMAVPPRAAGAGPRDLTDKGKYVRVDLQTLIENVYVAPFSEPWFKEVIESLLAKYGVEAHVIRSDLYTVY